MKLIALDLDGTLFNNSGIVTKRTIDVIKKAKEQGHHIVISTGRPFCGVPMQVANEAGIEYAITTNGAAVYEIATKKCIYEDAMDPELAIPVLQFLLQKDIHFDVFMNGDAYSDESRLEITKKLDLPDSLKYYILNTRIRVPDICSFIVKNNYKIQKTTINFYPDSQGVYTDREEVREYLTANSNLETVCGGYNNLEFTKSNVTKGQALIQLSKFLNIPLSDTIAIGDTENDLSILKTAGVGIAMGNATDNIKEIADDITLSNEEDGVAYAIEKYMEMS